MVLLYSDSKHSAAALDRSLRSLEEQTYPHWHQTTSAENRLCDAVLKTNADFVVPLKIGDELSTMALYRYAEAVQHDSSVLLIYGDDDERNDLGQRSRPWFKPEWNRELFLAQDYISRSVAIASQVARSAVARHPKDVPALVFWSSIEAKGSIAHVPHITAHLGSPRTYGTNGRRTAISEYVGSLGATCWDAPFDTLKVEWPLPTRLPLVSVLIPTKDKLDLLRACVEGVLNKTTYGNLEVLIIDNGSTDQSTRNFLREISNRAEVRVIEANGPYNFSALNNLAVMQARGEYLCLLNNDTEVITPDWLSAMIRYANQPHVGAVGAKLLYDDLCIQHAGVVVGMGEAAAHAHRALPNDQEGYFGMPHVAQYVSAVTAACLVVNKTKYLSVGGLDETFLAVAFNDVDFCLKLQKAGFLNVYTPHAVLLHHESKSRGSDAHPDNVDRYRSELNVLQKRWGTERYRDPLHNPNLDRYSETFVLSF